MVGKMNKSLLLEKLKAEGISIGDPKAHKKLGVTRKTIKGLRIHLHDNAMKSKLGNLHKQVTPWGTYGKGALH